MEGLIGDSNRSVSTLAITTLLKTGNEGSVDKLLKQASFGAFDLNMKFFGSNV